MAFTFLFIGDIYGKCGRNAVKKYLPLIKNKYDIDLVIENGENVTHGKGLSYKNYQELINIGVDVITLGNHFLKRKEIVEWIEDVNNVVRPANLDFESKGKGSIVVNTKKGPVRITNLLGRIFIHNIKTTNPFDKIEEIIKGAKEKIHIVDFHAEATSEKKSLAYFASGKISALLGTHTHIQTADERILNGTAYISDVGFCGAYESVLGINIEGAIEFARTSILKDGSPAKGEEEFNAVLVEIDENTGKAISIKRIQASEHKKENI